MPSPEDHTIDGSIVAAIVASLLFVFFSGAFLVCTVFVYMKVRRNKYTLAQTGIQDISVSSHLTEQQVCVSVDITIRGNSDGI